MSADIFDAVPHRRDFSFAEHTTYGCGGCADIAYFPRSADEACKLFSALKAEGIKFCILGAGSDVLAADGLYRGAVVCTYNLRAVEYDPIGLTLRTECGVTVAELLAYCRARGLSGMEFLAGIPATVGGLACMNGGAGGKFMSDCIKSVRVFDGELHDLTNEECEFAYKHSTMRDIDCIILSVLFAVERQTPAAVAANIAARLKGRAALPAGRSCGCVFENYCGVSAGKIIEGAGLKGARVGKAYVSAEHADFIINGGDSSADVYALIRFVKDEVYKKFGITLKEEVCYIGDFNDSNG